MRAGHVERMGEEREMYKRSVGNSEENGQLGRPRRKWEEGIRIDLREVVGGGGAPFGSGYGPLAGSCE
jgi:hypothetical protein